MTIVDNWKMTQDAGSKLSFEEYCRSQRIRLSIRAAPDGLCGFYALELAARALGAVDWSSSALAEEFLATRNRPHPSDASADDPTIVWATLLRFVKFANLRSRSLGLPKLCQRTIDCNLYEDSVAGPRAIEYISTLGLPFGVYICADFHPWPKRSSHCFLLEIDAEGQFASDSKVERAPIKSSRPRGWLDFSSYAEFHYVDVYIHFRNIQSFKVLVFILLPVAGPVSSLARRSDFD